MKKAIFLVLLIIFVTSVHGECQYVENQKYSVNELLISKGNLVLNVGYDKSSNLFLISNPTNIQHDLKLNRITNFTSKAMREIIVPISPNSNTTLPGSFFCSDEECRLSAFKYFLTETDLVVKENELVKINLICKGLNDGEVCSSSSSCGSGYCIEGYCSNDNFCYRKD